MEELVAAPFRLEPNMMTSNDTESSKRRFLGIFRDFGPVRQLIMSSTWR